jgi:hypothetical protein
LVLVPLLFLASLAAPTRQNQNAPTHGPSGALGRTKRGPPLPCKVSQGRANHTVCCLKSGNSIFLPLFRTHMGGSFWQCQKDPFFKSGSHFGWAKNGVGGCGRCGQKQLLLRPSTWQDSPFGSFSCLPPREQPVTSWGDADEAFQVCVDGMRQLLGLPMRDVANKRQLSWPSHSGSE